MAQSSDIRIRFDHPPVFETRLGIQFGPLIGFRSGHFGLFWQECLGLDDWRILSDLPASPREQERFGTKVLRHQIDKKDDFPPTCMRLSSKDEIQTVQFQPNKLTYGWKRDKDRRSGYDDIKSKFDDLFGKLERFADKWCVGKPAVDLWEITYVNKIMPGKLWASPSEWHRVLPGIFPPGGPQVVGFDWNTFNGTWYFEIQPQMGRVMVRAQKAVANLTEEVVLLLVVTARGEVGTGGAAEWSTGLDLGHQSALRVFHDIASPEALQEWGLKL